MTIAATHPPPDGWAEHLCPCRLPPPARRRAIRQAANVGLTRAASRLGVDAMTLSRWERGLHEPRTRYIAAYLQLLADLTEQARRHSSGRPQK